MGRSIFCGLRACPSKPAAKTSTLSTGRFETVGIDPRAAIDNSNIYREPVQYCAPDCTLPSICTNPERQQLLLSANDIASQVAAIYFYTFIGASATRYTAELLPTLLIKDIAQSILRKPLPPTIFHTDNHISAHHSHPACLVTTVGSSKVAWPGMIVREDVLD